MRYIKQHNVLHTKNREKYVNKQNSAVYTYSESLVWAWPVGVASGRGLWGWPAGMACGCGLWAWHLVAMGHKITNIYRKF